MTKTNVPLTILTLENSAGTSEFGLAGRPMNAAHSRDGWVFVFARRRSLPRCCQCQREQQMVTEVVRVAPVHLRATNCGAPPSNNGAVRTIAARQSRAMAQSGASRSSRVRAGFMVKAAEFKLGSDAYISNNILYGQGSIEDIVPANASMVWQK